MEPSRIRAGRRYRQQVPTQKAAIFPRDLRLLEGRFYSRIFLESFSKTSMLSIAHGVEILGEKSRNESNTEEGKQFARVKTNAWAVGNGRS